MLLFSVLTNISNNLMSPLSKNSTVKHLKILLLALLLVCNVVFCDKCENYSQQSGNISCTICQFYKTCIIKGDNSNTSYQDCIKKCCSSMANKFSVCPNPAQDASGVTTASIFMIVFFVIPALICFIVCIMSCCKNYRRRRFEQNQPVVTVSAINLQAFKIDDLGPFYQDRCQTCSICLDNNSNIRTKCGHSFHSDCLKTWIVKKESCPLCVSKQINPVLLYCTSCWKQSKMMVMREHMQREEEMEWQGAVQHKCQFCTKDNNDEISLNIENSQEAVKRNRQPNLGNQIVSIQSQRNQ